jgi:hypothetical protein
LRIIAKNDDGYARLAGNDGAGGQANLGSKFFK